jgi:cytochrome c biogenesis protein CcdA
MEERLPTGALPLIPVGDQTVIENVTLLAAFGAGLLSFISPCVLPSFPVSLVHFRSLARRDAWRWRHAPS